MKHTKSMKIKRSKDNIKYEKGDLIPMTDFQREFLAIRGKYVNNQEMEKACSLNSVSGNKMNFGTNPFPWEKVLNAQDIEHYQQARDKLYICQNPECTLYQQESPADYYIIQYKTEKPHANTNNKELDDAQNISDTKKFGRRIQIDVHVGVRCKRCKKHIKFVKDTVSNRRAAKDPRVSGPHQRYRR